MKKGFYIFLLICSVSLVACSNDNLISGNNKQDINEKDVIDEFENSGENIVSNNTEKTEEIEGLIDVEKYKDSIEDSSSFILSKLDLDTKADMNEIYQNGGEVSYQGNVELNGDIKSVSIRSVSDGTDGEHKTIINVENSQIEEKDLIVQDVWIVDLDKNDKYKEIAMLLYNDYVPSTQIVFYRLGDTEEIVNIGYISSDAALSDIYRIGNSFFNINYNLGLFKEKIIGEYWILKDGKIENVRIESLDDDNTYTLNLSVGIDGYTLEDDYYGTHKDITTLSMPLSTSEKVKILIIKYNYNHGQGYVQIERENGEKIYLYPQVAGEAV